MVAKKCLLSVACSLLLSPLSFAKDEPLDPNIVDAGNNLNFTVDLKSLGEGKLQIATKKYVKSEFEKQSLFSMLDTFNLKDHLLNDDFIMVTKTAFMFKASHLDFTSRKVTHPNFLKAAFSENDTNQKVDDRLVYTEKTYYNWITNKIKVHFGHCLFDTTLPKGEVKEMGSTCQEFEKISSVMPYDLKPQLVSFAYFNPEDISSSRGSGGTYGAITYNLYYAVGGGNTLHVSYKIVTFKNEEWYHNWKYAMLGLWEKVRAGCEKSQKLGTLKSLANISSFVQQSTHQSK